MGIGQWPVTASSGSVGRFLCVLAQARVRMSYLFRLRCYFMIIRVLYAILNGTKMYDIQFLVVYYIYYCLILLNLPCRSLDTKFCKMFVLVYFMVFSFYFLSSTYGDYFV